MKSSATATFKRKTSEKLKKLQKYLFDTKPNLDEEDFRLLLLGDEKDLPGLMWHCATNDRKNKSKLKKSSHTALAILYQITAEYPCREEFVNYLVDLEDDELKGMALHRHILESKKTQDFTAFKIAQIIHSKRKFLPLKTYIQSPEAVTLFEEWKKN
mmetsp:Transcript_14783/g.12601  ORF Transcript_14783/g.12601 Transcript_14783/m.12601 type:complete len:157 (+) Transcript_14783:71-541(+)